MIGEIWEAITDGISTAWESITQIPEMCSGLFNEINFMGWLILTLVAEFTLWIFWYYVVYVKNISSFLDWKVMIIATLIGAPAAAYVFAWREAKR